MKNKLVDLNNHLFAQLERLGEEDLSAEQLEQEVKRTEAAHSQHPDPAQRRPWRTGGKASRRIRRKLRETSADDRGNETMRSGRIPYSAEEMAWLEANFKMVISDYHRAFVDQFGRSDVKLTHLNQLRKRKGWKVGRDGSRYKGRLRTYTSDEMVWLKANHTLPIAEYQARFVEKFGRAVTASALNGLRKRYGWKTGRTGQFHKGQISHNKGKVCAPGTGGRHPNAQRTQFKKGQEPHNTKFLGHERVTKDGYVEISIDERNPYTGYERRHVLKHLHLWEAANGHVPEGHCLKCADGNRRNTDPENWILVPRGVLPRLNGGHATRVMAYDSAPAELKPALMTLARLDQKSSEIRKHKGKSRGAAA